MVNSNTVEKKASQKNSIIRFIVVSISIIAEITLYIMLFTRLVVIASWLQVLSILASFCIVFRIYAQHKTASLKMPWIILLLALPLPGMAMYLMVGLNGHTYVMRRRYEDVDRTLFPLLKGDEGAMEGLSETKYSLAGVARHLEICAKYPLYKNTGLTYYPDSNSCLDAMLEAMGGARKFIFMEYHAIEDAVSWGRIEKVLNERAAAGVEVRVFYDDLGSISFINNRFTKRLISNGIRCKVFNPFLPGLNVFLNNRDHRKITVVDGVTGFTGGFNLADEYFNITHPYGMWKDSGIKIEGNPVKSLTIMFLEMWNSTPELGVPIRKNFAIESGLQKYLPDSSGLKPQEGFIQPYGDIPMDNLQTGEDVYINIIEKAERYCYFMTPYLIISDEMARALTLSSNRGVDVRIITPGIPDKKTVFSVTRSFYNVLVREGVRIYEWTPGFCHAKMCVADDVIATCGTINLDYRSLYHHFENGCVIYGCSAVQDIRADFSRTFEESTEVTEQYLNGRSASLRFGQVFLRMFAGML